MIITLEFDGACEPINPGGVPAYGWAIRKNGSVIRKDAYLVPEYLFCFQRTNNVAEFYALIEGLEGVLGLKRTGDLIIMGDSNLVINCVSGKWKTKSTHLKPLRDRARYLVDLLKKHGWIVTWKWIPREQNKYADSLSKEYSQ